MESGDDPYTRGRLMNDEVYAYAWQRVGVGRVQQSLQTGQRRLQGVWSLVAVAAVLVVVVVVVVVVVT